ncbi:MAG: glycosyltransferase family 2 protein [Anaerolineae bacterium]|nr:glycosyltransferase family 2 protein [Anaerolineae bacterium]
MDLAVIIVNWNVRDLLRRCLASLDDSARRGGLATAVIVVDNASHDGSAEMVKAEFPGVRLVASERNLGFTAGNNLGLRALFEYPENDLPRYVLFLNPDTEVVGDALATMVRYLDAHPAVGVIGPQLRYPDGTVQPSRRRFPTLATAFLESTLLQRSWPRSGIQRRYYVADVADDAEQEVDWLVGACLMVRRTALTEIGGFDEGFFMYSEELDWCRRAKALGWRVAYLPAAQVLHYEGKSSEQVIPARHIHFQASKVRYFHKYHGWLAAEILRLFLLATYVFQWGEEGVKWSLGHKRALRAERMRAYGQVLRSGLRSPR